MSSDLKTVTSKSQLTDWKKESLGIGLATLAVHFASAGYILMSFIALPLSVHYIVRTESEGCVPSAADPCVAPSQGSQGQYTLIITLMRIFTFLFGNFLGAVGDKYGRRPVIVLALFGYTLAGACWALGWQVKTIALFYIGAIILGVCSPATPHGVAYVSDISIPSRQAGNLGILNGFGSLFGLLSGAIMSLAISASFPVPMFPSFATGLGLLLFMTIVLALLLPESLHQEERSNRGVGLATTPIGILSVVTRTKYTFFIWLCALCTWVGAGAAEAVTGGWWMRRYLTLDVNHFISYLVFTWIITGFGSAIMTKLYAKVLGTKLAVVVSIIFTAVGGIIISVAPDIRTSYIGASIGFFGASSVPSILAILMSQVPPEDRGLMSGTYRTSEAMGKFIGSGLFGAAFASSIAPYTPDKSCVPDDYSPTNKANTCECGVQSCPVLGEWLPSTCSLGDLTPRFYGSPSKFEPPSEIPDERRVSFVDSVIPSLNVTHDATCTPPGGAQLFGALPPPYRSKIARVWCAFGTDIACGDFNPYLIPSDVAIAQNASDTSPLHHNNLTLALIYGARAGAGELDVCPEEGTNTVELCWAGPISSFPGLIPILYSGGLAGLALVFFLIAELLFGSEAYKIVPLDQQGQKE